jgi:MFS family permease
VTFPDNRGVLKIVWDALLGRPPEGGTEAGEPDQILGQILAMLVDAQTEVGRADQKGVILLVTTGAAAGLIVAGLLGGQWRPHELPSQVEWLWWTGMFFWLAGILMLVGAIHPRSARLAGQAVDRRRSYVHGFTDEVLAELRAGSTRRNGQVRVDLIVLRIRRLSAMADAKYRYIRRATILMLIAIACCVLSVLIGQEI